MTPQRVVAGVGWTLALGVATGAAIVVSSVSILWMHAGRRGLSQFGRWWWWNYLAVRTPGSADKMVNSFLIGVGTFSAVMLLAWLLARGSRRVLRAARPGDEPIQPVRSRSALYDSADWLSMRDAQAIFCGPRGVVIGEAYRVDQDSIAGVRFDAGKPATWGKGGTAPLLIDPHTRDGGHGLVFAGMGAGKTTGIVAPSLDSVHGWPGASVVLDPSCQVGPMLAGVRRGMGQKVVILRPGLPGFDALDWIDTRHPEVAKHLDSIVKTIGPDDPKDAAGENGMFHKRGKDLQLCLLSHMVWDPSEPVKTLKRFAELVATPEKTIGDIEGMRDLLGRIHERSASAQARRIAGTLMAVHDKTFTGMYSHANSDVSWLGIDAYADMLSGDAFRTDELCDGKLTVFIQIDLSSLIDTPEVGKTVINALLRGVFRREGRVNGRILWLLDEINLLGRMKALEIARDNARKYGITIVGCWQSIGQMASTFGADGKAAWYGSSAWRLYAAIDDKATAEEVEEACGTYTALVRSEGASTNTPSWMAQRGGGRSRGASENLSEQKVPLITRNQLRLMRLDEAIVLRKGASPIRCGIALCFRRPDMKARFGGDPYRRAA